MRIIDRLRTWFTGEAPQDMGRTSTLDLSGTPLPDTPEDDGRAAVNRRLDLEQARALDDEAQYLRRLGLYPEATRRATRAHELRVRHLDSEDIA